MIAHTKFSQASAESETSQGGPIVHEVLDLRSTRELRTLLLQAVYELHERPCSEGATLILISCQLSRKRVLSEVELFKAICQPDLADRLTVVDPRDGNEKMSAVGSGNGVEGRKMPTPLLRQPTKASQEAVMAYLMWRHIMRMAGVTIQDISLATGASLPTVYQVINAMRRGLVRDNENKTWLLENITGADWKRWLERANRLASVQFVDRSGSPRSPRRLAERLSSLGIKDVAIGGLMGALHYLPALDATAAPYLDLLVHGTARSDLSFIRQLDPGLERSKDPSEPPHVVVHFVDRPNALFKATEGHVWGALPDCIANMHRAGLAHQVDHAIHLIQVAQHG